MIEWLLIIHFGRDLTQCESPLQSQCSHYATGRCAGEYGQRRTKRAQRDNQSEARGNCYQQCHNVGRKIDPWFVDRP
jgi:hypothetical protein